MSRLLHEAGRRLKARRRDTALIGAVRTLTQGAALLSCLWVNRQLSGAGIVPENSLTAPQLNAGDLLLSGTVLAALPAFTPLRVQSDWQLGRISGTLDANDLGFLAQSRSLWLWGKAIWVRFLLNLTLIASCMPAFLLYIAAKALWLTIPPAGEGLLPLMTVLHLGLAAAAAGLLPLRIYAAGTALPYCYLKTPHESPVRILRLCFRLTRSRTPEILLRRILLLPLMLIPPLTIQFLPALLTAEQIRCERAWRHLPRRSRFSRFAFLELHAYDL